MEITQEEFEEAQQRLRENAARDRRYKKNGDDLEAELIALRARIREINHEIAENRQDRRENQSERLKIPTSVPWLGYDSEPDGEEIADIAQWSRDLRRRAWGAAFGGTAFGGKTGTTDLMLLLSLGYLMEIQGTRIIEADIPEIVRVSALDYKTVVAHMQSLRSSGYLLRVATHSYALVADHFPALDQSLEFPSCSLAHRFVMGDRCSDAFGGKFGIGITEIRIWVWMLLNPGATRYAVAKGAGVGTQTAYRTLEALVNRGLAKLCEESGHCHALRADKHERIWLEQHADSRGLLGAVQARVNRAIQPQHLGGRSATSKKQQEVVQADETRIIDKAELDFEWCSTDDI